MPYEILDDAPQGRYEELPAASQAPSTGAQGGIVQGAGNLLAGAVRGAGSIGATILAPYDMAKDALAGKGFSLESNRERRQGIDDGLKTAFNADPESWAYKGGKLLSEVAGTAGTGGVLAKGLSTIPMISKAAPLVEAIGSSGFKAGGMTGLPGLGVRAAGGALTGGVSAGLVDPEDAKMGALIGGAMPAAVMGAGKVGGYVGDRMMAKQAAEAASLARNKPMTDTLRAGLAEGYVVPPSSVNPSLTNSIKESISGKIATAQVASSKNQEVTDGLVRRALGISPDAPLSVEALSKYRADMHQAGYDPLRQLGAVKADGQFASDLGDVLKQYTGKGTIPAIEKTDIANLVGSHRSTGFDAGDAVDAIRVLREDSKDAFRKGDTAMGKAQKAIADAYEGALERAIPAGSNLLDAYKSARANIAKSFTVEDALKEGTGAVDARKLAAALQKGTPLSGDLLTAARFASAFPKATQPPSLVAGPGVHNLKAGLGALSAAGGASMFGPAGAAVGAAYPFLVPPVVRAQMFSKGAQQALIPAASGPSVLQGIGGLLSDPTAQQGLLQVAPTLGRGLLNASY